MAQNREPVAANTASGAAASVALPKRQTPREGSSAPVWSLNNSADSSADVPLGVSYRSRVRSSELTVLTTLWRLLISLIFRLTRFPWRVLRPRKQSKMSFNVPLWPLHALSAS